VRKTWINRGTQHGVTERDAANASTERWENQLESGISVETMDLPLDKYDIITFAKDDSDRFQQLVSYLCPRDQEIMLLYAVLQKRPTDLSILFGKAGHRAEEDVHKAAHKLAGLIEFGAEPPIAAIEPVLVRSSLETFGGHSFAACLWQYARTRNFREVEKLIGRRGLRQQMFRVFKQLHAKPGREEGLLAGWILWLVGGSDPHGTGWIKRRRSGAEHKLGPTVFRSDAVPYGDTWLTDHDRKRGCKCERQGGAAKVKEQRS
jgi:hypothetical protein